MGGGLVVLLHFSHKVLRAHDTFFTSLWIRRFILEHEERVVEVKRPFIPKRFNNLFVNLNDAGKHVDTVFFSVQSHVAIVLVRTIRVAALTIVRALHDEHSRLG